MILTHYLLFKIKNERKLTVNVFFPKIIKIIMIMYDDDTYRLFIIYKRK